MGIHMLLHFMDYLWTVENEGGWWPFCYIGELMTLRIVIFDPEQGGYDDYSYLFCVLGYNILVLGAILSSHFN
jgi:hypothetical protein